MVKTNDEGLIAALRHYAERSGENVASAQFSSFLRELPTAFDRSHHEAHFTASAWLVSADGQRVLLLHHRKLDRWLQPGGHADGERNLARVALREASEETGVEGLLVEADIFDLDRHRIPARGGEPEHWHYDVRYVVRAGQNERFVQNGESRALAWRLISDVACDASLDDSVRRMARKWLQRSPGNPLFSSGEDSPAS